METKFVADECSSMEGSGRHGAGNKVGINNSMRVLQGTPVKAFTCKYCSRIFLDSRGLGGHQNLHKRKKRMMLAIGVIPKSHGKKTIMVNKMEIGSHPIDPSKPAAGVLEPNNRSGKLTYWRMPARTLAETDAADGKSYQQHPSIYYSDLPSAEVITKGTVNYTGMWPPDALSSSGGSPQHSYDFGFVHNLDLDLHL